MWPFRRKKSLIEQLRGYKKITVGGMRFTIKRINPLLDFTSQTMPQIFTDFKSIKDAPTLNDPTIQKKIQEDMYAVIQAGVVEPSLVKEDIKVEDLFRDPDIGVNLYREILEHSFNKFKGLKKVFFSITTKYKSYIAYRKLTGHYRATLFSRVNAFRP